MWKVRPVLGRRAEGLPVRDVGIASLDALDFVLDEAVVRRRHALPLLRRSVDDGVSARRRLFGPFTRCRRQGRGRRGRVPAAGDQAAEAVLLQQLQARVRGAGYLVQQEGLVVRVGREVERVGEVELPVVDRGGRRRRRGDGGGGGSSASDSSWWCGRRRCVRRRAREEEAPHVDGEQAAAVAASYRHRLEQAARRHAHDEDGVAEVAVHVAELLGCRRGRRRYRRELMQRREVLH